MHTKTIAEYVSTRVADKVKDTCFNWVKKPVGSAIFPPVGAGFNYYFPIRGALGEFQEGVLRVGEVLFPNVRLTRRIEMARDALRHILALRPRN